MNRRGFWLDKVARRICRLIGHRRESYRSGFYVDRRGRTRERYSSRCVRCGSEDGCYDEGVLEAWQRRWWGVREDLIRWRLMKRSCCGKPLKRFGRPVGDHRECDDIPF